MPSLAYVLCLLACQPPSAGADDAFARLGLDADLAATVAAWRPPPARVAGFARPALAQRLVEAPAHAGQRAEAFVRDACGEIRTLPLLRAAGVGFGCARKEREKEKDAAAHLDARGFEDLLERAHRSIVRALGSGREPGLAAPALQAALQRVLQPGGYEGMTEDERGSLRDVCERAGKVDMAALHDEVLAIVRAALAFAKGEASVLARAPTTPGSRGVSGAVVFDRSTPFGRFVIGGVGPNEYECDQVAVIVDLGGDDTYHGPAGGAGFARRLSMVVDLAGNDTYRAQNDGLGSATFGVGILLDLRGNDRYAGDSRCAGFGAAGVGVLFDLAGDDELVLARDGGGVGFGGLGVYLDAGSGKDRARVGPRTLGCGLPGGFGMFVDDGGDDEREIRDGDALGRGACGVGFGVRGCLPGGVGLFVDVAGIDHYTGGDLVCGAGIDGGAGVFFEVAGDDVYMVGEFALGSGRDHGLGVFIDAAGDDGYRAAGPSLGCACGFALGLAEDRAGQDVYEIEGAWPGAAEAGGLGAFFDFDGKDRYRLKVRPIVWPQMSAAKVSALSLHEDRGGDIDLYDTSDGMLTRGNDVTQRQRAAGAAGEVLRVFADH